MYMSKSQDFEGETKSRAEEVNAIRAALKALESSGGAGSVTYGLNQVVSWIPQNFHQTGFTGSFRKSW